MLGWPRRRAGRRLSDEEHARYAPFFEPELLAAVRLFDGHVPFWLRPDMLGVTLGPRIHFRPGAYDADTADGIELLGHELAHVHQFRQGMTVWRYLWASRRGYRRNRYEVEAFARGATIRAALE
jgi:hypothetical protein